MALGTLVYTKRKIELLPTDLEKIKNEAGVGEKRWAILTRTTLPDWTGFKKEWLKAITAEE